MDEIFLFVKEIDKSVLTDGISIPVDYQSQVYTLLGKELKRGDRCIIQIKIGSLLYEAKLTNLNINRNNHPGISDKLQIRYTSKSLIVQKLREIFSYTYEQIQDKQIDKCEKEESIGLYFANGIFIFKPHSPYFSESQYTENERSAEQLPYQRQVTTTAYARSARIVEQALDRAGGICQLCGQPAPFTDKQGNPFLEVHHVQWLSRGGKDSIENVVALCPNCHSRMHIRDEENDKARLQYYLNRFFSK